MVGVDHNLVKRYGRRVEIFSISDDEQLIGCKLDQSPYSSLALFNFVGITLQSSACTIESSDICGVHGD